MVRLTSLCFGLASLLLGAPVAEAQVFIKAPLVRVQTYGPDGVYVRAPLVTIDAPPSVPGYYLVPGYVPAAPAPVVAVPAVPPPTYVPPPAYVPPPQPAPAPVVVHRAGQNHYEFARVFVPSPGRHEVILIHPGTGAELAVSFTLPVGNPKVRALPRGVVFDYGSSEVTIHFAAFGKVRVVYR